MIDVEFGEKIISGGGMFIKVLVPSMCLMGDEATGGISVVYGAVRGW